MNYEDWHSSPPPSLGWWPASAGRNENVFRWWNGRNWSYSASSGETARLAAKAAKEPSEFPTGEIEWKHRPKSWPARSQT
jgi:hypothetical protein